MQTWWNDSPYLWYGVYIGGDEACDAETSSSWFSTVSGQSWDFLPIWVGPQAPCTTAYTYTFPYNTTDAYDYGYDQAVDAVSAMNNIGFSNSSAGDMVIYYDMESFDTGSTTCDAAVQSFLLGWDYVINVLLLQDAGYCASADAGDFNNVATISDPPNDIYFADWINTANSNVTYSNGYIKSGDWVNDQRAKQYDGKVKNVTYGGVIMNSIYGIDFGCSMDTLQGSLEGWAGSDSC